MRTAGQDKQNTSACIMILDDEPTTIDVLEMILHCEGYQNLIAETDSRRAMELLTTKHPDLVLLDLKMPHVDGFQILKWLRKDDTFERTPVIVLTSSADSEEKLRALELGATDFLNKPVDPSELALRLRNTLAAKAYQDRLIYYDGVTGLPNKQLLIRQIDGALDPKGDASTRGAVLHIELDRFEQINDSLGQGVGDTLLKAIAGRLKECVRSSDPLATAVEEPSSMLSHLGRHEFALFLRSADGEDAARVARRIITNLADAFRVDEHDLFVTCSIGIAVYPEDGEKIETLVRHAKMSHLKQAGRNTFHFYSRSLNVELLRKVQLENQLRMALDREEMLLHYQPKVDFQTGRIIGAEALIRWQHPELGLLPPGKFIPIAEETDLIGSIGDWVLRTACHQNRAWQDAGLRPVTVSVNVSSRQFVSDRLLKTVEGALKSSRMAGRYLVLELTEGILMENPKEAAETVKQIKSMALKFSIDDFGTGYSGLSYLKRFQLDELKIDRSFVQGIPDDADSVSIVTAIIAMAQGLGLRVVAEGVETEQQRHLLAHQGCNEYQGFLFSKPVSSDEFADLLRKDSGRT